MTRVVAFVCICVLKVDLVDTLSSANLQSRRYMMITACIWYHPTDFFEEFGDA